MPSRHVPQPARAKCSKQELSKCALFFILCHFSCHFMSCAEHLANHKPNTTGTPPSMFHCGGLVVTVAGNPFRLFEPTRPEVLSVVAVVVSQLTLHELVASSCDLFPLVPTSSDLFPAPFLDRTNLDQPQQHSLHLLWGYLQERIPQAWHDLVEYPHASDHSRPASKTHSVCPNLSFDVRLEVLASLRSKDKHALATGCSTS